MPFAGIEFWSAVIVEVLASGPAPIGPGDVDGSGSVNAADVLYLLSFLFGGGAAPVV